VHANTGRVHVSAADSGNWLVRNPCEDLDGIGHTLLVIEESVTVSCLSGDFTVEGGRVEIKTDLQTSGKLTFRSPRNAIQPEIFVAEDKTAEFSEVCP